MKYQDNIERYNKRERINAVVYARYSCSGQREESIEGQIKVNQKFANDNNINIIDYYADEAKTGTNDDRYYLQKLLKEAKNNKFEAVIVYALDRFGRGTLQSLLNENKLNEAGVLLLSATEPNDFSPAGVLSRQNIMAFAQYFSSELSVKVKRGREVNASKGLTNGGLPPFGYKIQDKHFVIDETQAPYVVKIFEMYASGKRIIDIVDYLNSNGVKTSRGNSFTKNSLHTILHNEKYIGVFEYDKVRLENHIPRILSDELFEKVARMMKRNKKYAAKNKAKADYLLTTKLFCGNCKSLMTGCSGRSRHGGKYYYYYCNHSNDSKCKNGVRKELIEDIVIKHCVELLTDENIEKIANEISKLGKKHQDASATTTLKKRLKENEKEKSNIMSFVARTDDESIQQDFLKKYEELKTLEQQLKDQIAIEQAREVSFSKDNILSFLKQFQNGDINDSKYRHALVDIFVNSVYLYNDKRVVMVFNIGEQEITIDDTLLMDFNQSQGNAGGFNTEPSVVPKTQWTHLCLLGFSYIGTRTL